MTEPALPPLSADKPALFLRAQYIKDLSFESPRAPASVFQLAEAPQIEVSINLAAQRLDEKVFELTIHIAARAISEKTTVFLCDVAYAGVIEMQNMPENAVESTIFIQGAQLLYPFARRVVADLTRDGGFPPLQLAPVDFEALFLQRKAEEPGRPAMGNA